MSKPVTPQDMFDLWQKMVNPGAYPLQSLMFPVLDAKELAKKVAELETVEHWLKANLGMLQLTIKSLEFQRAMLEGGEKAAAGMRSEGQAAAGKRSEGQPAPGTRPEGKAAPGQMPNPAEWAWNMMAQAGRAAATPPAAAGPSAAKAKKPATRKKRPKPANS
jgi:hypothetical protein